MSPPRLRVGVIGCGLIAQVMHLPHLRELDHLFEVAALCDISPGTLERVADDHGVQRRFTRWEELIQEPLDAVLVLTPGSHAPAAIAAARAGLHVFVEKPMCVSVAEGRDMLAAAGAAGVQLMVGYMKRFDPAYERLAEVLPSLGPVRLARFTTLEAPLDPYLSHIPLVRSDDVPAAVLGALAEDDRARTESALGAGLSAGASARESDGLRRSYREALLDSMIHDLNAARGVLGEPDLLEHASIRPEGVTVLMRFGGAECVLLWVDLPGLPRYEQDWSFYASDARASLKFPSPFLRNAPTLLVLEEGGAAPAGSRHVEEIVSYDEAFRRELGEFHACITEGRVPRTDGVDGLRDVALCKAIVEAHLTGGSIEGPTVVPDVVAAG